MTRYLLLFAVAAALLAVPSTANADHEHPNAPCWSNGYGDGTDNDGWMHPYIHFTYASSCGTLAPQLAVSAWFHPGAAGTGVWDRVFYKSCSFAFNCHHDLYPNYNECKYRAGVDGGGSGAGFEHHYHYHHYACVFI